MLGVAGILAQEIVKPNVFFYNAGLPENLPNINFGGPDGQARPSTMYMPSALTDAAVACAWMHIPSAPLPSSIA